MARPCDSCAHCGYEPDCDAYCDSLGVREKAEKETGKRYPFGLSLNSAWPDCKGEFFTQHPLRTPPTL